MKVQDEIKFDGVINCITGRPETFSVQNSVEKSMKDAAITQKHPIFSGLGLIDLQVNGINGIDFNIPSVTQQDMINATQYLLSIGVTTFFPTIVTNSDENILQMLGTIHQACEASALVNSCVGGIHLEGPFISPDAGAKGAHEAKYIKAPDWELFTKFQQAAAGKIKLITISPEWEGSAEFIEKCRRHGTIVSIGHSIANTEQINRAVKAGARLSTHIGNGVPLTLPRHPNIIWDQLAADELYSCIIGDGIHIPDSFIKVVIKIKKNRTILVSDATCFAGMPPGEYQNHIGGTVTLDNQKRISLKSSPGMLAGAATSLLENIECLLSHKLATLSAVWQMASTNAITMLEENNYSSSLNIHADLVMFQVIENKIKIRRVIKNNQVVFEQ